jgi:hypothetical protein
MSLLCPVSIGELVDKLTILEIKLENITDPHKIIHVQNEYDSLMSHIPDIKTRIIFQYQVLKMINNEIWIMIDQIRKIDSKTDPNKWIEVSRKTMIDNDRRFRVKKQISQIMDSNLKEQKSTANTSALLIADLEQDRNLDEMIPFIKYLETLYDFIVIKNYKGTQIKDPIWKNDPQLIYHNDANQCDFKEEDIYYTTTISQRIPVKDINTFVTLVHKYIGNYF